LKLYLSSVRLLPTSKLDEAAVRVSNDAVSRERIYQIFKSSGLEVIRLERLATGLQLRPVVLSAGS
jgi:hypothetical protein